MTLIWHPKTPGWKPDDTAGWEAGRYAGGGWQAFRLAYRKTAHKLLYKTLEGTL
jgi:hypothetical protein